MLERSLVQPERTLPDIEPLSSMVAAANPARSIIFRIGAPLILVTMFGALLAWGYTGESASQPAAAKLSVSQPINNPQILPVSYKSELPKPPFVNEPVNRSAISDELNPEQARRTAARFASRCTWIG